MKFGQLTVGKIIKIFATRCQILRLKCTKFNFGWGSLQRSPDPLARLTGPTSKGSGGDGKGGKGGDVKGRGEEGNREGKGTGRERGKGWDGKGRGGEGNREGKGSPPFNATLMHISGYPPGYCPSLLLFSTLNSKDTFSLNPVRHPHPLPSSIGLPLWTPDCSMVFLVFFPLTF